jgi:acetyl esterase/lipase
VIWRRDLAHETEGGYALGYDLVVPEGPGPFPLIVFIHGGGWISGDRSDYAEEAEHWASLGYAGACVSYRLAPLHPFPAAVVDVRRAIASLRAESARFGIDSGRLAAFGNSAGGHLAAMAGMADGEERPNAVVSVCPITDLTNPHETHLPIGWAFLEQFMGGPYSDADDRWRQASPARLVRDDCPPFFIAHGEEDDVVPFAQGRLLAEALAARGVDVSFLPLPGEGHSFTPSGWRRIREAVRTFLHRL